MVFNSIDFLFYFLPIFFLLYLLSPDKIKNATLLSGSLVFYAMGEPYYLVLLILSVYINYYVGLALGKSNRYNQFEYKAETDLRDRRRKRRLLFAAVIGNIGVLAFFKLHVGDVSLPLGLSFYTFQVMSYLIDVYRGTIKREGSLLGFATYIIMFPKLISGPITDYEAVKEDLSERKITAEQLQEGLKLFALGLGLKVLLADRVGILWHEVQVTGFESISTGLAWLAAIAYSMKIYFDFYGYSLMAMGLGHMLGFSLPVNFQNPYAAKSVREFYRRWHMTLGGWFCKYVYIPLGGSRGGEVQTVRNLLIVWVLTALWHGTTANFLLWGILLWICIVLERQVQKLGIGKRLSLLPHLYLWVMIPVSWMCFAITDTADLTVYLGRMFGATEGIYVRVGDWQTALGNYGILLIVAVLCCTPLLEKVYHKLKKHLLGSILLAVLFWVCVHRIVQEGNNPFMYFRF